MPSVDEQVAALLATRKTTYQVFEQRTLYEGEPPNVTDGNARLGAQVVAWVPLGRYVATSRKEAIKEAVARLDDERRYGRFATALAGQFVGVVRERIQTTEEVWS